MALREEWTDSVLAPLAHDGGSAGGVVATTSAPDLLPPLRVVQTGPVAVAVGWPGKRVLDICCSAVLMLLLAPLMLGAALAVKLSSRGPVLFRQPRVGRGGREFRILKFRTMCTDAEEQLRRDTDLHGMYLDGDHKIPCRLDPRVTRLGRIFRTWSIDELPQLFNVLVGDMSLVGPRPVVHGELVRYAEFVDDYLAVRPGLTGLWQTSGRNQIVFPARAELDAWYRRQCTPLVDLKILVKTPLSVLRRQGSE